MDRSAAPQIALAAGLLVAPLLAPVAQASHAPLSLPLRDDDPRVRSALDWFEVREDGCVHHPDYPPDPGSCPEAAMKWVAVMAASAGADPRTWPRPNASVGGWLLAHADGLQEEAQGCTPSSGSEICRQQAVFSRAKSILAFAAAGVDPRAVPLPDGGTRDLVAELMNWYRGGQFGGSGYVSDDVFALVALNTIGYTSDRTREAADLVASAQGPEGGLGWELGGSPTPELTGAAVQALAPRDKPSFVDDALGYLASTQNRTGPRRACWDASSPDAGNTAWALLGLVAAGEDPRDWAVDGRTPTECLASLQAPGGGFRPTPGSGSSYIATHEALTGLAWTPYGQARGPQTPLQRNISVRVGEETTLAASPDTTVRGGNATRPELELRPGEPGLRRLHGLRWTPTPRLVTYRLDVHPPLPAAPTLEAPRTHAHPDPVPVDLEAGGTWTAALRLVLPNGTVLAGGQHDLALEPGLHRLEAWALNARGEAGPAVERTVLVRNPPPQVHVQGPARAAPGANVTLSATASDPAGEHVTLRWETLDGTVLSRGPTVTLAPQPDGNRTVVAVAADAGGGTARARRTVNWTAEAPSLDVTSPSRSRNGSVRLVAEAGHPRQEVTVTWHHEGRTVARGRSATLDLAPGNHTIQAVAATADASVERAHRITVPAPEAEDATRNASGPPPAEPAGGPSASPEDGPSASSEEAGVGNASRPAPAPGLVALLAAAFAAARRP